MNRSRLFQITVAFGVGLYVGLIGGIILGQMWPQGNRPVPTNFEIGR